MFHWGAKHLKTTELLGLQPRASRVWKPNETPARLFEITFRTFDSLPVARNGNCL